MKKQIKIGHSPKTVELADGTYLHFFYANNKGRGNDNCTIVRTTTPRNETSTKMWGNPDKNLVAIIRTSAWRGNVNFSKYIQECLGL